MEPKQENKVANILSLIGIVIFFVTLITIAVVSFKNKSRNNTEEYYAPVAEKTTPTEIPVELDSTDSISITDISVILNNLANDISNILQCNNPNTITLTTPGIKASMLTPLRTQFEKASVDLWQIYKADVENSTGLVKGDYLLVMDLRTATDTCKLYVYIWTDYLNSSYVISTIDFEIGDF